MAGVHWAAGSPAVAWIAWAEQPPSAGTDAVLEAHLELATTTFPAVVASAFPDLWLSHARAADAVQAHTNRATASRATASRRSDFMDPTSRKVMTPRPRSFGERVPPKMCRGNIGWPRKIVSPGHAAGVRHVQKAPSGSGRARFPGRAQPPPVKKCTGEASGNVKRSI